MVVNRPREKFQGPVVELAAFQLEGLEFRIGSLPQCKHESNAFLPTNKAIREIEGREGGPRRQSVGNRSRPVVPRGALRDTDVVLEVENLQKRQLPATGTTGAVSTGLPSLSQGLPGIGVGSLPLSGIPGVYFSCSE